MKNDESVTSEEIFALIGRVVSEMLTPDNNLQPHELSEALHRLSTVTLDNKIRGNCEEVMRLLMQKMH